MFDPFDDGLLYHSLSVKTSKEFSVVVHTFLSVFMDLSMYMSGPTESKHRHFQYPQTHDICCINDSSHTPTVHCIDPQVKISPFQGSTKRAATTLFLQTLCHPITARRCNGPDWLTFCENTNTKHKYKYKKKQICICIYTVTVFLCNGPMNQTDFLQNFHSKRSKNPNVKSKFRE